MGCLHSWLLICTPGSGDTGPIHANKDCGSKPLTEEKQLEISIFHLPNNFQNAYEI